MLTTVFCLLVLAVVVMYFFAKKRKQSNQSHATVKRRYEPRYQKSQRSSLGKNPLDKRKVEEDNMDDRNVLFDVEKNESDVLLEDGKAEQHQQAEKVASDYIVLHLSAAADYPYSGYELLQALLANGMRYGDMNIFHRYENKSAKGSVLFSLASINKPGTFDLSKMGSYSCPGLTFFMTLTKVNDPSKAFDLMLATAKQLQEDLGGELWDENRQLLNMDKVAVLRKNIKAHFEANRVADLLD